LITGESYNGCERGLPDSFVSPGDYQRIDMKH
jgi:hypothetical protein